MLSEAELSSVAKETSSKKFFRYINQSYKERNSGSVVG